MSYKDELIAASKGRVSVRLVTEVEEGRLALFPELVEALRKAEATIDYLLFTPCTDWERLLIQREITNLRAVRAKVQAIEKEAQG